MPKSDYELLKPFLTEDRVRRIEEVLARRTDRLVLVLENLYDPHNLSAILRTAEAAGIQHVVLTGAFPESLNPDIAIGAERWLTLHREPDPAACLEMLREKKLLVAGSALSPDSVDPGPWEPRGPVALVLGNEHEGISETFLRGADLLLRLPSTHAPHAVEQREPLLLLGLGGRDLLPHASEQLEHHVGIRLLEVLGGQGVLYRRLREDAVEQLLRRRTAAGRRTRSVVAGLQRDRLA